MDTPRRCTECGTALPADSRSNRRTCSDTCKSARSRRKRKAAQRSEEAQAETYSAVSHAVRDLPDHATLVAQQELRPVIREAMTEEVLKSLREIVTLTPKAIKLLEQDLESPDPALRHKAYAMVLRYTLGRKDVEEGGPPQVGVTINVPRPGDSAEPAVPAEDIVELRVCEVCEEEKDAAEFEGSALRCIQCQSALRQRVMRQIEEADAG